MRIFTKEILGSECIGNSLSTINDNFDKVDQLLKGAQENITLLQSYELPIAGISTTGKLGGVKIGDGLSITTEGVISTVTTGYVFRDGLTLQSDNSVLINVDNTTTAIIDNNVVSLPSPQDTWTGTTSSNITQANTWVNVNSSKVATTTALTEAIETVIPQSIKDSSTWVIDNSAAVKEDLILQKTFSETSEWVAKNKEIISQCDTWVIENSADNRDVSGWVHANSSAALAVTEPIMGVRISGPGYNDKLVTRIIIGGSVTSITDVDSKTARLNIGVAAAASTDLYAPKKTQITCDGNTSYLIEGYTTNTAENYLVFIDGIAQTPTLHYTINNSKITLNGTPPVGSNLTVLAFQGAVNAGDGISQAAPTDTDTSLPVGTIITTGTKTAPNGWLACDGSSIDIITNTEYADLVTAIYCGDTANNTALYGYRSTEPTKQNEYRITVLRLQNNIQPTPLSPKTGLVAFAIKGGSGTYTLTLNNLVIPCNTVVNPTVDKLDDGMYTALVTDIATKTKIEFSVKIGEDLGLSYIDYRGTQYTPSTTDTFVYASRSITGRYFFLPDMTSETKRNTALNYYIKY